MRLLALMFAASLISLGGCGSSTLAGPCSLSSPCSDGEICDFTDPNGLTLEIAARSDLPRMRDPATARAVLSRWTAAGGRHETGDPG